MSTNNQGAQENALQAAEMLRSRIVAEPNDGATLAYLTKAIHAERFHCRLLAVIGSLMDAVSDLSDEAREEFGGADDEPVKFAAAILRLEADQLA